MGDGTVEVETSFQLIEPDGTAWPVRTGLRYDPADPYAVQVTFYTNEEMTAWIFARELLMTGLDEPAGTGDVRVWPWEDGAVALALSSDDGKALFLAPRKTLAWFLRRTYLMVARYCEAEYLNIDQTIESLLGGRSSSDT